MTCQLPASSFQLPGKKNPCSFAFSRSSQLAARSSGFTLVELLVICAILVAVSSVILVNNSRFGGVIRLESLTYEVALSIRQAQVYGISVARFGTNTYSAGYGIHLDLSSPNLYTFFADAISTNGLYDTGELVKTTSILSGYQIAALCSTQSGVEDCTRTKIDILYKRPEPDAWIAVNGVSCIAAPAICYESARVILKSPRSDQMSVVVDVNGQISVRKVVP